MPQAILQARDAYQTLAGGNAPDGLTVEGVLDYSRESGRPLPARWPSKLCVELLNLSGRDITQLPPGLQSYELNLSDSAITSLPPGLHVVSRLNLTRCERLESLPAGLSVGTLILRGCTALAAVPDGLDVWFLDLSECWAVKQWPQSARIRSGQLQLRSCVALSELPQYLNRLSALSVRDCPNLKSLPPNLVVTGWLELAHSGLTSETMLPPGLANTQLRWAGVNVDRRIAFHPEEIRVDEVLGERNAERRRVLLDRYGYGRFVQDAAAEVLDADADPGGARELLRVKWEGDEDLVAMSCICPSTGRQYIIRVPPMTTSCRHAAAWIAGFDDPNEYQPLQET